VNRPGKPAYLGARGQRAPLFPPVNGAETLALALRNAYNMGAGCVPVMYPGATCRKLRLGVSRFCCLWR